jgi:hypothetical protein
VAEQEDKENRHSGSNPRGSASAETYAKAKQLQAQLQAQQLRHQQAQLEAAQHCGFPPRQAGEHAAAHAKPSAPQSADIETPSSEGNDSLFAASPGGNALGLRLPVLQHVVMEHANASSPTLGAGLRVQKPELVSHASSGTTATSATASTVGSYETANGSPQRASIESIASARTTDGRASKKKDSGVDLRNPASTVQGKKSRYVGKRKPAVQGRSGRESELSLYDADGFLKSSPVRG